MEKRYECNIQKEEAGKTVKQILTGKWQLGSGQIKKAKFRENGITVNGKQVTVRFILSEGDLLRVLIEDKDQGSAHLIPVKGQVTVLYEDEDLIVVKKPAGMVCHPSGGHYCDSMANLLVNYFAEKGEGFIVRLAGRLDKDTSGMLLFAKNAPALTNFEKQRLRGSLKKTYYAIVCGNPKELSGVIEEPIGPDPLVDMKQRVCSYEDGGARAVTHYEVLKSWICPLNSGDIGYSLLRIQIETGRTHQIRCHMAWLGHPLAGDRMYGGDLSHIKRHALHAGKLEFLHPTNGEKLEISLEWPQDMKDLLGH